MESVRKFLELKFELGSIAPGVMHFHCFSPVTIIKSQLSPDDEVSLSFRLRGISMGDCESKISKAKIVDIIQLLESIRHLPINYFPQSIHQVILLQFMLNNIGPRSDCQS